MTREEARERVGAIRNRAENYLAARTLDLTDELHLIGLTGGMKAIERDLRRLFFDLGGEPGEPDVDELYEVKP